MVLEKKEKIMKFTEEKWFEISKKTGDILRLDNNELSCLRGNIVGKLITAIPYIANCKKPDQTALNHLIIYMVAKNPACKNDYLHTTADDESFFTRLKPISKFKGGVNSVIERGMNLLALMQLEDHRQDMEIDKKNNKYNPVLSGAWNYEESRKILVSAINNVPCPEMDRVVKYGEIMGYWDAGDK